MKKYQFIPFLHRSRDFLYLALAVVFILSAITWLVLQKATDFQHSGFIEQDHSLYLQYAHQMATGHPYVFTPGDTPSSGSTTHLYIWLLALLYKLGVHGDAFIASIFCLNVFFYLASLALLWGIARKLLPEKGDWVVLLVALSGQTLTTFLGGTDMGFFTFLTLALFFALLYNRWILTPILAFLCGIARPEGFLFAIAALVLSSFLWIQKKRDKEKEGFLIFFSMGLAGLLGFFLTLFINHAVTGHFQFMSVMNKGYFHHYNLSGAVFRTLTDFLLMIRELLFGLSGGARQYFVPPILGGVFGLIGVLLLQRNRSLALREIWILLAAGASMLLIATSEYQGVSNDRYLGWLLPIWFLYIVAGVEYLARKWKAPLVFNGLLLLLAGFQCASLLFAEAYSYSAAILTSRTREFAEEAECFLPSGSTVGTAAGSGIQFFTPELKIRNFPGYLSPDLFIPDHYPRPRYTLERLKHRSEFCFDYWMLRPGERSLFEGLIPGLTGQVLLPGTDFAFTTGDFLVLSKADWSALKGGELPSCSIPENFSLLDTLDVAYITDERAHNYTSSCRLTGIRIPPVSLVSSISGETNLFYEAGRVIVGEESFQLHHIIPNHPLLLVLRTARRVRARSYFASQENRIDNYELKKQIKLSLSVDASPSRSFEIELADDGFCEISLLLSAEDIHSASPKIKVFGDHISFIWWAFQPVEHGML